MRVAEFFVPGVPATQGSKKLVRPKHGGRYVGKPRMIDDNAPKLKKWRTAVAWHGRAARTGPPLELEQPVRLMVTFRFARPKKPSRSYPCKSGGCDVDKLMRAIGDALTGITWTDDSQIVQTFAHKRYANQDEEPGAAITVEVC